MKFSPHRNRIRILKGQKTDSECLWNEKKTPSKILMDLSGSFRIVQDRSGSSQSLKMANKTENCRTPPRSGLFRIVQDRTGSFRIFIIAKKKWQRKQDPLLKNPRVDVGGGEVEEGSGNQKEGREILNQSRSAHRKRSKNGRKNRNGK